MNRHLPHAHIPGGIVTKVPNRHRPAARPRMSSQIAPPVRLSVEGESRHAVEDRVGGEERRTEVDC